MFCHASPSFNTLSGWLDKVAIRSGSSPLTELLVSAGGSKLASETSVGWWISQGLKFCSVQKTLRSLFADKSSRILRVLLTRLEKPWIVQDLSAEAGVSIGLTSRVKQRLIDFELIPETSLTRIF